MLGCSVFCNRLHNQVTGNETSTRDYILCNQVQVQVVTVEAGSGRYTPSNTNTLYKKTKALYIYNINIVL